MAQSVRRPRQHEYHHIPTARGEVVFDVTAGALAGSAHTPSWGNTISRPVPTGHGGGLQDAACEGPFPWPRARYPDTIPSLVLNTHRRCTLRCRYCYAHPTPADYERAPMTPEVARRAIDFLVHDLGRDARTVTVEHGLLGDPMLAPGFVDEVDAYARAKAEALGKRLRLQEGATMSLAAGTAAEMVGRWPGWIGVSLDGPAEVHDRLRPFADGRGSYQTVVENVQRIRDSQTYPLAPKVTAQTVLTALEPDVTRLFLHLFELGFDSIMMRPVRMAPGRPGAIDETTVEAVNAGYTKFGEFLLSQDADALLAYLRPIFHIYDFFGKFLVRALHPQKLPYRCSAGKWHLAVDVDGTLYPCAPFAGARKYALGSVDSGIDPEWGRFWAEELFIENRQTCQSCWTRYLCGGGCYYQSFLTTGHPARPSPVECELTRHVAEVALQVADAIQQQGPELLEAMYLESDPAPPVADTSPLQCGRVPDTAQDDPTSRWRSDRPLMLADREWVWWKRWQGPDDLSVEVHVGQGDGGLYLSLVVGDDVFVPASPATLGCSGDSLELNFHLPGASGGRRSLLLYRGEEGAVVDGHMADPGSGLLSRWDSRAICDVARHDSSTEYRAMVPWEELPGVREAGQVGLSLRVNDDDAVARGYLSWPGGSGHGLVRLRGEE